MGIADAYGMKKKKKREHEGNYSPKGGYLHPDRGPQVRKEREYGEADKTQDESNAAYVHESREGARKEADKKAPHRPLKGLAEGGSVEDGHQSQCDEHCVQPCMVHEMASGYEEMPEEHEVMDEPAMHEDDLVARAMKRMAEGGRVANGGEDKLSHMADGKPNDFDVMRDDDLEMSYTGANSGDHLGNKRTEEDERDLVSRIMASRRKGGRMPHPK